ncbi:hypothetical protein SAMN05661008_00783 [Alkalithermobacter thermoalcaliphilus JW-YL-7 = DSM 7308]|uniref:Uncharacterized protein n=1 Tax=Alkalithermobacter thermoalcaliphilus JW-YL-7 = DSM 7308 TaxID=1121328 RepID=A0A150FSD3_CLOPD|nr:hypothetical protein JWYL7_1594 [[Clostridium] paradoxum JW-YL-7 = DSM 7308]SHK72164.1 hypothetical protein SAMN05661008_00783 [[Clostridium] paradoxum JW-YL-7 = DSM 7308]
MFFLKKDTQLNLQEDIIKKRKIPLLIENDSWKKLFNCGNNNQMQEIYHKLKDLSRKKKSLESETTKLQSLKRKCMAKIVYISDQLNINSSEEAEKELDKLKDEINILNEKIEKSLQEIEDTSKEIKEKNVLLLEETIKFSYSQINSGEKRLKEIEKTISELREKLNKSRQEKEDIEKKVNVTYHFLHSLLGYEEIEKLDKELLK